MLMNNSGLIPEIIYFNIMICANTLVTLMDIDFERKVIYEFGLFFSLLIITIALTIDILFSNGMQNNKHDLVFWVLNVLTVTNVILAVVVQIYIPANTKENSDYENKYENYLLNKIDSKQESNKNKKEEVKSNIVVQDLEVDTDITEELQKINEIMKNYQSSELDTNITTMFKNINETRGYYKDLEQDTDIFAEMLKNYNETREYFKISKFQSKFSFFVSVFSAIAGFIILAVAIYGIIDNEHLEVSIIAAVSGAITEIASVVVLGIHNKSALQLNYYYDALHENEKLLSAINMADKLNADKREEMYMEIIRKQIDIQPKKKEDSK